MNDTGPLGDYFQRPVRLQVFEASVETTETVDEVCRRYPPLQAQIKPEDFRVKHVIKDRELKKLPGYQPQFRRYPLKYQTVETEINRIDYQEIKRLVRFGLRKNVEEAVRIGVMEWYAKNRAWRQHPLTGARSGFGREAYY